MIRKAAAADLDAVENIYDQVHQAEEDGKYTTGWKRGIYPTRATAEDALKRDDLFVLEENGAVLGAGIINHIQAPEYKAAPWEHKVDPAGVCVLHTLTVSPRAYGRGLGKQFVAFYEAYAGETGCRELRIDTNERNRTARSVRKTRL